MHNAKSSLRDMLGPLAELGLQYQGLAKGDGATAARRPWVAIDGRWGLRWPRDARGESVYRLITELGFLSRPYDVKVFGDQSAHPEVVKKVGLLHPVEILMTPNDTLWQQSVFLQAARGARLIHATAGAAPVATRIPRVVTFYADSTCSVLQARVLRRAAGIFAFTAEAVNRAAALARDRKSLITRLPLAPAFAVMDPLWPKEPFLLIDGIDRSAIEVALRVLPGLASPPMALRIVVHTPEEEGMARRLAERAQISNRVQVVVANSPQDLAGSYQLASAVLIGSESEDAVLSALNAKAAGTPVVACAPVPEMTETLPPSLVMTLAATIDEMRRALLDLLQNLEEQQRWVAKAQDSVRDFSWKKTAEMTDHIYQTALNLS